MDRVVDRQSCVETQFRFVADVAEVFANRTRARLVRDGSVAGDHRFNIEGFNAFAGAYPIFDRTGPHDGRALDEEDVARKHSAIFNGMNEHVAAGMRGADFDEFQMFVTDLKIEMSFKGARNRGQLDPSKFEHAEDLFEERTCFAE